MAIVLPQPIGEFQELESSPERVVVLATHFRAVAGAVSRVQAHAARNGAPGDFDGEAGAAAEHAATRFARRLARPEVALLDAAIASDRFEDRLRRLKAGRIVIEGDRLGLDADLETFRHHAAGPGSDADIAALEREAARLRARADRVQGDIDDWTRDYAAAETDYIAALRAVDTVRETAGVVDDPGRPDLGALLSELFAVRDDPEAVNGWWRTLDRAQRQALIALAPDAVGNTDGIPVRDRDEANRTSLYGDLDHLGRLEDDGQLSEAQRQQLANARAVRDLLDDYRDELDPDTGDHLTNLIVYEPGAHTGDGGVAISLGDPDRADHVGAYVPGTTTETTTIEGSMDNVYDLYSTAVDEGRGSVSTILWLDYDAPSADALTDLDELADLGSVVTPAQAVTGAGQLEEFVAGLRASDRGEVAHVSLIGHSYGATTAAQAAYDGAPLDEVVLLGSPGAPSVTADALTDADVYVGSADHDPVTLLGEGSRGGVGALGSDPAQESFGAHRFPVAAGSYRVEDLVANHSTYFQGRSLEHVSDVLTGAEPDEAPRRGAGDGYYQTLTELLIGSSSVSGGEWLYERGGDLVGLLAHHPRSGVLR